MPQGVDQAKFDSLSSTVRAKADVLGFGDDIFVQGSRAGGTARLDSDLDLAIRVSPEEFDRILNDPALSTLSNPNLGSALADTRAHAIEVGKLSAGRIRLSTFVTQLEEIIGLDVQLSIIRAGGRFDNGPQSALSFDFQ